MRSFSNQELTQLLSSEAEWWQGLPAEQQLCPPRSRHAHALPALRRGAEWGAQRFCSWGRWQHRWSCTRAGIAAGTMALADVGGKLRLCGRSAGLRGAEGGSAFPSPCPYQRCLGGCDAARPAGEVAVPGHPPCPLGAPLLAPGSAPGQLSPQQKPPTGGGKGPPSPEHSNPSHPSCSPGAQSKAPLGAGREGAVGKCSEGGRAWLRHSSAARGSRRSSSWVQKLGNFASDKPVLYLSLLFFRSPYSSLE